MGADKTELNQPEMSLHIFPNLRQLGAAAALHVAQLAAAAIAARGGFTVVLSGGSLPKILGPALAAEPLRSQIDWPAWQVAWADERCLPQSHPDSNYFVAKEFFFDHVPLLPSQIYNPDTSLDPARTAAAYQATLARLFDGSFPQFDLIMLGLGEDGHTASLFPGHPLLWETERWVAPIFDSPKPPPARITLTLPVLNQARQVIFITAGAGKADVLAEIFGATGSTLPAKLVQPTTGQLHWLVDQAAAAKIGHV
jgi:6-phosphogluconolactonase